MNNTIEFSGPIVYDYSYPPLKNCSFRHTVRAYAIYRDRIYLTAYSGQDMFGNRQYVETAGGGIKKDETPEEALTRELEEELGAKGRIIKYLGQIGIEYYLLNRFDISDFFIFKIDSFSDSHLTPEEATLHQHIVSFSIDELLDVYLHPHHQSIEPLVYQRDIYYFQKYFDDIKQAIEDSLGE